MIWIITIKYNSGEKHDPRNKKQGICEVSEVCTDKTGKHHCFLVHSETLEGVKEILSKKYRGVHITRIELGKFY